MNAEMESNFATKWLTTDDGTKVTYVHGGIEVVEGRIIKSIRFLNKPFSQSAKAFIGRAFCLGQLTNKQVNELLND